MQTMDSGLCGHKISRTLMEAFLQSWCDRTLAYSTLVYYQVPVASEQLLSSRQDKEEELAQQFEWIEEFMEGFRLVIVSCIEHRASSIFCWFNLSHPATIKSALWLWILCAISIANVVQKRVKSEFRGIRPLMTNNLLYFHHCLLLVLQLLLQKRGKMGRM